MGTGTSNQNTQAVTRITKPPKCSICRKPITEVDLCDWRQGRCPHKSSMLDNVLADTYKSRFYNLIKFFKGNK